MQASMFDSLVKKLVEEKDFEEMYLVYFIKKLKELYNPSSHIKITMLSNLNKRTSLKKGNLVRSGSKSGHDEFNPQTALAVFYPSILKEDEICLALDKLSIIDSHITQIDLLTIFGDQESLQKRINENKIRDDLNIEVYAIGSTPVLESYDFNIELAKKVFLNEFKN